MYTHICPIIFVCTSLYVTLKLINSHKAKKCDGGATGCLWWDLLQTAAPAEKTEHWCPPCPSLPGSPPPARLNQNKGGFENASVGITREESTWVMQESPITDCHATSRQSRKVYRSTLPNLTHHKPENTSQSSATNLKPAQKPQSQDQCNIYQSLVCTRRCIQIQISTIKHKRVTFISNISFNKKVWTEKNILD